MTTFNPDVTDAGLVDAGKVTGTRDRDYDLVWFLQACLSNALRLEQYLADAEADNDDQLIELFTKAQIDSKKGAALAKELLRDRLSA
ncbi:hypothetical protein D0Z08_22730 [Nocardioides immobilis]|uniref:Uncharacterized protein n=1 Tax=Nocardioides immobilis TaxID=2049295 RepID=A0A417XWA7_9ACTN|nr:hypothetical protein [Nocardioides immobilis]RHW24789.1 hypothetical protein D0Z08_22730 [Nocardioides immobilis]